MKRRTVTITSLVRDGIAIFGHIYEHENGRDDTGLSLHIRTWLKGQYQAVIAARMDQMIDAAIMEQIRNVDRESRPTAGEIEGALFRENHQLVLPTLDQVRREWYRPGRRRPMRLATMTMSQVTAAIQEYGDGEREHNLKRRRLQVILIEMLRRGFSENDRVSRLYAA